ncbi:MAG: hypothetical protein HY713_12945 [candidate division NC10 bacterium]|nr:hypothetical protein [candidate division NC10 bacterium]
MSKYHFCRRFRDTPGLSFREYLARRRIARAKELPQEWSMSVPSLPFGWGSSRLLGGRRSGGGGTGRLLRPRQCEEAIP